MSAQNDFKSMCDQMSKEVLKPFLAQKEHIFIDSDLLYDYRLGAVLALTSNEEQYMYVVQNLPMYLNARDKLVSKYFPDLNITDELIEQIIRDSKYFTFISAASPATAFIDNIEKVIRIFNTINESKEVSRPITLTINQRTIDIHPVYKRGLTNRIASVDPSVVVNFTSYKSWFDVPEQLVACQDFLCVYDMIEFLKEGTPSQKAISSVPSKLSRCSIVTPWQSDVEDPLPEHFRNLKVMMEVMCNQFSFINRTLCKDGELITNG